VTTISGNEPRTGLHCDKPDVRRDRKIERYLAQYDLGWHSCYLHKSDDSMPEVINNRSRNEVGTGVGIFFLKNELSGSGVKVLSEPEQEPKFNLCSFY